LTFMLIPFSSSLALDKQYQYDYHYYWYDNMTIVLSY